MVRFATNLQTAVTTPSGPAARALQALGISEDYVRAHSDDLTGMLELVAQRLDQFAAGGNRAAIEAAILGQRMGPELTPILTKLAQEGFQGLIDKARETGDYMDDPTSKNAKKAAETFHEFSAAVTGLGNAAGTLLLPALTNIAELLTDIAEKTQAAIRNFQALGDVWAPFNNANKLAQRGRAGGDSAGPQDAFGGGAGFLLGAKPNAPSMAKPDASAAKQAAEMEDFLTQVFTQNQARQLQEVLQTNTQMAALDAAFYATKEEQVRADYAAGKITSEQEVTDLAALENQKYQAIVRGLEERRAFVVGDEQQQSAILSQEAVAYEKHLQTLLKLDEQYARQQKQIEDQAARDWEKALMPVEGFFSSMINSMISSHRTFAQAVLTATEQMVEREAADLLKMGLKWVVAEAVKTGAARTGAAARTTIGATENTSLFGQIGQALSRVLGFETSQTAATEAGEAARAAARTAAATASLAGDIALGFAEIEVDASVGAAAAFADSAELGPEGLAAAPAVAAATYAEILGFAAGMGGGVALAEGAWNIPGTMAATLHAGEAVLPRPFAEDYRANNGGAGGVTVNLHVNAVDGRSVKQFFKQNMPQLSSSIASAVRDGSAQFRGMVPVR